MSGFGVFHLNTKSTLVDNFDEKSIPRYSEDSFFKHFGVEVLTRLGELSKNIIKLSN